MKVGQTVYTVNNKENCIDLWIYNGVLRTKGELLLHLVNGNQYCFLPARCVFESEEQALVVAMK